MRSAVGTPQISCSILDFSLLMRLPCPAARITTSSRAEAEKRDEKETSVLRTDMCWSSLFLHGAECAAAEPGSGTDWIAPQ